MWYTHVATVLDYFQLMSQDTSKATVNESDVFQSNASIMGVALDAKESSESDTASNLFRCPSTEDIIQWMATGPVKQGILPDTPFSMPT